MPATATERQDAGLDEIFHTSDLSGREWLFLLVWPPPMLGAEELRKAVVRRSTA